MKKTAEKIFEKIKEKFEIEAQEKKMAIASIIDTELKITDSKIEGIPYIPVGKDIPKNKDGKQFMFLAQINCEDLKGLEDFAKEGILQFWILGDDLFGLDFDNPTDRNGFEVIYYEKIEEYYSEDEFKKMYNPYNPEELTWIVTNNKPYKLEFSKKNDKEAFDYELLYDLFEKVIEDEKLKLEKKEKRSLFTEIDKIYGDYFDEDEAIGGTKCDGFPFFTQGDPRNYYENLKEYDTLLFQIDSYNEKEANEWKILIGDCGVMNFFINREKLKNKDFSDILYTWDCY